MPPPSEPRFKVIFADQSYFEGYFQEHHNIFVCLTEDNLEDLSSIYGPENKEKVKEIISNNKALGYNKTDVWAKNQNVFYITAKSHDSLLVKLKQRSGELMSQANKNEVSTGVHKVLTIPTSRDSIYLDWMGRKGFALRKPNSYRVAIDNEEFLWLRKNTDKHDYGLMVHYEPYTSEDQFSLEQVIERRNEITQTYIPGEVEGSFMVVDPRLEPHFEEINFNGKYAVVMKGWWRVKNDLGIAGPFVSYSIYDKKSEMIVTVEGYVYGPNESKAKALREIEVILQSLVIK